MRKARQRGWRRPCWPRWPNRPSPNCRWCAWANTACNAGHSSWPACPRRCFFSAKARSFCGTAKMPRTPNALPTNCSTRASNCLICPLRKPCKLPNWLIWNRHWPRNFSKACGCRKKDNWTTANCWTPCCWACNTAAPSCIGTAHMPQQISPRLMRFLIAGVWAPSPNGAACAGCAARCCGCMRPRCTSAARFGSSIHATRFTSRPKKTAFLWWVPPRLKPTMCRLPACAPPWNC